MDTESTGRVRDGLSTVTRGTVFLLVATLLFVLLNFISRVIIVRNVSADEWSAFSWALTLSGLLAAFGTLGLPSAVARNLPYASSDAERRAIVRGTILVGGIAGLGVTVALFLSGPYIGARLATPDIGLSLQFFSVAVGSVITANLLASIFQGYEDVAPNALLLQIVAPSLFVVFLVVGLQSPVGGAGGSTSLLTNPLSVPLGGDLDLPQALLAYALANVLCLALTAAYTFVRLPRRLPKGPRTPSAFPRLLRFAAPLFIAGVLSSLNGNGDTIILGLYNPTLVGGYSASLTLARLLQVGINAAAYIFLPVSARLFREGDKASVGLTYGTVTKWMLLFSLPLFVLFAFLSAPSLAFVYGARYAVVVLPLQITVAGAFASTLFGPGQATQVALGETRLVAYNALAAAVADVGLALWLVPLYGAVGAAIAWGVAATFSNGLAVAELAALHDIHPFRPHFAVPLLATGIPVGIFLALWHPNAPYWTLPGIGLAVAALFLLLVVVTRSVDKGDRLMLDVVERMVGRPLPLVRRLGRLAFRWGPPAG